MIQGAQWRANNFYFRGQFMGSIDWCSTQPCKLEFKEINGKLSRIFRNVPNEINNFKREKKNEYQKKLVLAGPYIRHAKYDIDFIFYHIEQGHPIVLEGYTVKLNSLRLETFYRTGTRCVCCGAEAKYFALESEYKDLRSAHLNLYAEPELLMTKDHIFPSRLGGPDHIDNLQTMCEKCNGRKNITYVGF